MLIQSYPSRHRDSSPLHGPWKSNFKMTVFAWNQFSAMLHAAICCHCDPNSLQDKDTVVLIA